MWSQTMDGHTASSDRIKQRACLESIMAVPRILQNESFTRGFSHIMDKHSVVKTFRRIKLVQLTPFISCIYFPRAFIFLAFTGMKIKLRIEYHHPHFSFGGVALSSSFSPCLPSPQNFLSTLSPGATFPRSCFLSKSLLCSSTSFFCSSVNSSV